MFDSSGLRLKIASLRISGGDKQLGLPSSGDRTMHEVEQRQVNGTLTGRSMYIVIYFAKCLAAKPCARPVLSNSATDVVVPGNSPFSDRVSQSFRL
jgi:hypothetical protein